ncbi:aminopeptidase [Ulvibacter litoralis]|nr:aminopeptidase [Ulvibacter litoralis]
MKVTNVALDGIKLKVTDDKIWLKHPFKAGKEYTTLFSFEATPKQTLYFTGNQIWTQGQGKYTSHWLPSIDDVNDKMEFDITIVAAPSKTVIANGKLLFVTKKETSNQWHWDMERPMASYLVAFAIGDFEKQEITSNSGIPIELYYEPKDSLKVEPTYRYTKQIFDFLEAEIGVPYPWQNYKQVPVRDFLYAGMENTTATFFSEAFVNDSIGFTDRNYVNVNAHELAHQWFGNLVTETESMHHWLQEGFATYYALLAEREVFGDDYYYWKLYQSAEQLKALSDEGKGESLLNPKASSLTFYEKGAWALHILKEQIGEEAFNKAIKNYLEKYRFKNVTTPNFLAEVKAVSRQNIEQFEIDWLQQTAFKAEQAYQSLRKSLFITNYFKLAALKGTPFEDKLLQLDEALTFPNDYIGQEAIYQLIDEPISETLPYYKKGFESNNVYVRQTIALTSENFPKQLQKEYESLLKDDSYVTKEAALYGLWTNFPENRKEYLDATEGVIGFQNKNIRQLWLVLALVDANYKPEQSNEFLTELKNYTSDDYSFEVREVAFGYIQELRLWDEATLHTLVNAATHHSWRFRKFARSVFDSVVENETYQSLILKQIDSFSEKEKNYIQTKLKE